MLKQPFVSIVVTSYNYEKYILKTLESIKEQTYKDYEIIIVDDNDPNTEYRRDLEIEMEKYKNNNKIIYVQHEKNMNGAVARNTGIKIARGEYITFLDDDDYFLSNRLETMIKYMEGNKGYDCAYSNNLVTKNKKIIGNCIASKSGDMKKELLLGDFSFGSGSNMFFRANAIKKINGFTESFLRHQDVETMLRFFNVGKLLAVNEYLLVKVQDDRSNQPNIEKYVEIKENYFKAFEKEINKLSSEDKKIFYISNYFQLLCESIRRKDKINYKKYVNKIKEYGKLSFKMKLRIILLFINNYVKIEKVKYLIKKWKLNFKINKEIKKEIEYYESL